MRIGLIAALRRSEEGLLRAELSLAGRPVLAWQADLLQALGAERVLCLTDALPASGAVLALQHRLESSGTAFHALKGLAAIPALVRAEDDLIIIADGLLPEPAVVSAVLGGDDALGRAVASIPADHVLAVAYPEDFERIDAARSWAGVLAMRGAPVQQLADLPADGDVIALLLRLALQAGTLTRELTVDEMVPERWLLATSPATVAEAETRLIARAAAPVNRRAPAAALAGMLVRSLVPRGLSQGGLVAAAAALLLMLGAVVLAAVGPAGIALLVAGLGAFAGETALCFSVLASRLQRADPPGRGAALLGAGVDVGAGVTMWFALAPWPEWQPLAVLGPLVIGLARLASMSPRSGIAVSASDRTTLLVLLAGAAFAGVLPEALACLALGLLAALLLRASKD